MDNLNIKKLKVLITIIPRGKKEIIKDLLENFEVNFSFSVIGRGTSSEAIREMLGLVDNNRDIIFSIIRSEKTKDAILALEDKFKKFKYNQSVCFAIPMASVIGIQNYLLLSNLGGEYLGK